MPGRGSALARRSHPAPRVVSPRNKVNIALPLSMIRVEEPVKMRRKPLGQSVRTNDSGAPTDARSSQ